MTKLKRYIPLFLAALAISVIVSGCGNDDSQANKYAEIAAKQEKNPPKIEDPKEPTVKVSTGTPGPGEGDINKKPVIPKQTGDAPTDLLAEDLIVGKGTAAKEGDQVAVQYLGVLRDTGKEFDSSWKRNQPFNLQLGAGQVIKGWDQGVAGMKVGGRRQITIPPNLGYGKAGAGGVIKGGETLVFVVDLLGVS